VLIILAKVKQEDNIMGKKKKSYKQDKKKTPSYTNDQLGENGPEPYFLVDNQNRRP
jgi:hypothetical protein